MSQPSSAPDDNGWVTARRSGTVTAVRVDAGFNWRSQNGDLLTASPGDWRVEGRDGSVWSVAGPEFTASYSHVEGTTWRRTGLVSVRRGVAGERLDTLEGTEVVAGGDWVIKGQGGEVWSIAAGHFAENYELIP